MSPSTTPEAPATTTPDEVDLAQFGIPQPNIVGITVEFVPQMFGSYKGVAPSGIAIPDPSNPQKLGINALHTIHGFLIKNTKYTVSYQPVGPGGPVMQKQAVYVGTNFNVAIFNVVD